MTSARLFSRGYQLFRFAFGNDIIQRILWISLKLNTLSGTIPQNY